MSFAKDTAQQIVNDLHTKLRSDNPRESNSKAVWDYLWNHDRSGHVHALRRVYGRIITLAKEESPTTVADLGGGAGALAFGLHRALGVPAMVLDISTKACSIAEKFGLGAVQVDFEECSSREMADLLTGFDLLVGTEFLEHLTEPTRALLLQSTVAEPGRMCMWSVPNNCMGPDEEPQHTVKWTSGEFELYLHRFYPDVTVEEFGRYMLGVCRG